MATSGAPPVQIGDDERWAVREKMVSLDIESPNSESLKNHLFGIF